MGTDVVSYIRSVLQWFAVLFIVLQSVAARCSVLQRG